MTANLKAMVPFRILIADDDLDDIQLTRDSFKANNLHVQVEEVADGQYLIETLKGYGKDPHNKDLPQLILLDLNMPRKGGFEVLAELKADENLKRIPVIVFTTSNAQNDIDKSYKLGACCYVTKPNSFSEWSSHIGQLGRFWIDCVKVPF